MTKIKKILCLDNIRIALACICVGFLFYIVNFVTDIEPTYREEDINFSSNVELKCDNKFLDNNFESMLFDDVEIDSEDSLICAKSCFNFNHGLNQSKPDLNNNARRNQYSQLEKSLDYDNLLDENSLNDKLSINDTVYLKKPNISVDKDNNIFKNQDSVNLKDSKNFNINIENKNNIFRNQDSFNLNNENNILSGNKLNSNNEKIIFSKSFNEFTVKKKHNISLNNPNLDVNEILENDLKISKNKIKSSLSEPILKIKEIDTKKVENEEFFLKKDVINIKNLNIVSNVQSNLNLTKNTINNKVDNLISKNTKENFSLVNNSLNKQRTINENPNLPDLVFKKKSANIIKSNVSKFASSVDKSNFYLNSNVNISLNKSQKFIIQSNKTTNNRN